MSAAPVHTLRLVGAEPSVGFIGAGTMGGPMVQRLIAAGTPVRLHVRRPEAAEAFRSAGAEISTDLAGIANRDVIVLCPFSEEQLCEILEGPSGLIANAAPGTVLVQHATISVEGVERLTALAAEHGVVLLDAPISGRAEEVQAGALTVLVGGPERSVDKARPVIAAYASTILRTGDSGSATRTKLVNNILFAANAQLVADALLLGSEIGLDEGPLLEALSACSASSFALTALTQVGGVAAFAEAAGPYLRKDVDLVADSAARLGGDLALVGDVVANGPMKLTDRRRFS
ncbi:MAG TPA: NAD(P)-dependent oxidoreductase [Marmoricola sp.]|jgi:3-hydroxyisobutyrate dehydrogenase-like beta-hydroxyacid dehydrogenase|nr:NAD(P)-dependent oxidoreductase [Marmoricola sp.]